VLGVTALGPDLGGAREHAYTAVDRIRGPKASAVATSQPRADFAARREDTAKIVPSDRIRRAN
jgi:hypothetical protein